ncbi:MAG TPA: LPS export ABC transporter permease LptG [Leucothrix mucor]|uniref:LPS export ABC transporter permease LptG n=1 Tax=Leucothrix mucor TaxID=45248 RepID=A0A7V2WUT8_LEUMU|nr:LPS export ABC transporter permease LptG [Leucothrix mucor]
MKILDWYLWKSTLQGLLVAWLALVMLDVFFAFINELKSTNDQYTSFKALIYLTYTLPARFYEFFPTATLVGSLLGLGNLAANSEFIAMRAAGFSIRDIIFSVLKLGVLLTILAFLVGEWVVPASDLQARNYLATLKNKNIYLVSEAGLWIKQKDSMIHIGKVWSQDKLSDVTIYRMKADRSGLDKIIKAESVTAVKNGWQLGNVKESTFEKKRVNTEAIKQINNADLLDAEILKIAAMKPEQLSGSALRKVIKHQKANALKSDKFELAYWKRFSVPLSTLVMLILAMPFLFGSQRGGGTGQRVFIGIIVGITFFLLNRVLNELGIVYGIMPIISAFLPLFIFLLISLLVLRRIR